MARTPARKAAPLDLGALLPMRDGLSAGGRRIRTIGPARERDGHGEGNPRPTIVVSRDPCLNDTIRLIGPASPFGNSRDPVVRAGPVVRIQFPAADSPSLIGSSAPRTRGAAFRAGVRAMGGGAVGRDGDRPAIWRLPERLEEGWAPWQEPQQRRRDLTPAITATSSIGLTEPGRIGAST